MKKRRFLRVGLIMLFLAGITLAVSVSYYNAKLNLLNYDYSGSMTTDTPVPVANGTLGIPLQLDAVIKLQTSTEQVSGGDIYTEADVLNILLIGTDERKEKFDENARADSIMLFSLHLKNHTVKLVSLERGIGVPIEGRNDDWLTHVFRYGGAELLLQTVRDCFKVDVDRYVRVNFYAFKTIIDSVGGVDIVLTKEEVKALNEEVYTNAATDVRVVEGLNHLSGHDTLQYCRLRFIDDDWHRIERQHNTIQSIVESAKDLNILEINEMLNDTLPLIKTNLKKEEITSLLLMAPNYTDVTVEQMTLPVKGTYWGTTGKDGRSLITIDFDKNAQILKEFLYGKQEE